MTAMDIANVAYDDLMCAQDAFKEATTVFELLLENTPDGHVSHDLSTRGLLHCTEYATRLGEWAADMDRKLVAISGGVQ